MAATRRYAIQIKATSRLHHPVIFTAVDWTDAQKQAAINEMQGWIGEPVHGHYLIEVENVETDRPEFFSVADWSDGELTAAVRRIMRWAGVPDDIDFPDSDDTQGPGANDDEEETGR